MAKQIIDSQKVDTGVNGLDIGVKTCSLPFRDPGNRAKYISFMSCLRCLFLSALLYRCFLRPSARQSSADGSIDYHYSVLITSIAPKTHIVLFIFDNHCCRKYSNIISSLSQPSNLAVTSLWPIHPCYVTIFILDKESISTSLDLDMVGHFYTYGMPVIFFTSWDISLPSFTHIRTCII